MILYQISIYFIKFTSKFKRLFQILKNFLLSPNLNENKTYISLQINFIADNILNYFNKFYYFIYQH
jgi:hypothetical protein